MSNFGAWHYVAMSNFGAWHYVAWHYVAKRNLLRYLFNHIDTVLNKIKKYKFLLLLLDYDGTLTPIVKSPSIATLRPAVKKVLKDLSCKKHVFMCILSGRSLQDIKNKVKLRNICYGGCHGLILNGGDINFIHPEIYKFEPVIRKIAFVLKLKFKNFIGVLIENKKLTVSLHYRNAAEKEIGKMKKLFFDILKPYKNKIKITYGKKILEVHPAIKWDKGIASKKILKLLRHQKGIKNILPIYIGDDLTDEDAFGSLKKIGITVLVNSTSKKSKALYYLKSPDDVLKFLKILQNRQD